MGRHLRQTRSTITPGRVLGPLLVVGLGAVVAGVALTGRSGDPAAVAQSCPSAVRVVTAASFAPVLTGVAPALAQGAECVRLDVTVADGRTAVDRVAEPGVDVWIPDDAGWASNPGQARLAEAPAAGTGAVVAESPFYLVADEATAQRVTGGGSGWLGLTSLVTGDDPAPVRLAVRDPGGSGDGMLGLGAFAESVWVKDGMDASAEVLAAALPRTRTVIGNGVALPEAPGEVGLVPEHGLLPVRDQLAGKVVLAPRDHTATLRYSWQPTAAAAADPARTAALDRVRAALTGPAADGPLAQAGLRRPGGGPPPGADGLPAVEAPPFEVLGPHHVDHVLATWYTADRRSNLLVAVDVSGSMQARAPGSDRALIEIVRDGVGQLTSLQPDDSQLTLWRFGTRLDGERDHEPVLRGTTLDGEGRAAVSRAVGQLRPQDTGTGLHDTILAAYEAARDSARPDVPSHVIVFTDGRNEADEPTLSMDQLGQRLAAAKDPQRPVELTVIAFGDQPEAKALKDTLKPVDAYVSVLRTADQVNAAFIHAAAHAVDA
jgi:hypothetical protein